MIAPNDNVRQSRLSPTGSRVSVPQTPCGAGPTEDRQGNLPRHVLDDAERAPHNLFERSTEFHPQDSQTVWMSVWLVAENTLRILQPMMLGWAVNSLMNRSYVGLAAFILQHIACMVASRMRHAQQSRLIASVSHQAATTMRDDPVKETRSSSRILEGVRQSLDFWEQTVPRQMHVTFSVIGSLVFLGFYDMTLIPLCLVLVVPAVLLNVSYTRKSQLMNRAWRAETNRDWALLNTGRPCDLRWSLECLTRWRTRVSETAASNACLMELFILGLLGTTLVHYCWNAAPTPGDVFAVFQYILMFVTGLVLAPLAATRQPVVPRSDSAE